MSQNALDLNVRSSTTCIGPDVAYWHKADIRDALIHVSYWGSGHGRKSPQCRLLTHFDSGRLWIAATQMRAVPIPPARESRSTQSVSCNSSWRFEDNLIAARTGALHMAGIGT